MPADPWCRPVEDESVSGKKHTARKAAIGTFYLAGLARRRPAVKSPQNILLIRPDHLGDVLLSFPAVRLLRRRFPVARITLAVGPWSKQIADMNPDVDEVITIPFPGFERSQNSSALDPYRLLIHTANRLRQDGFDTAVILRNDFWWGAMLAYLAGIPNRYGYQTPESALFITKALPFPERVHVIDQSLALIAALSVDAGAVGWEPDDVPHLNPASTDMEKAFAILAGHGWRQGEQYAVIHPGAGADVKLWNPAGFGEVARFLAAEYHFKIVLTGSAAERELVSRVGREAGIPVISLAGELDIPALAALMKMASLVVGVDSGPMHIAAADGTPAVTLFGPADPVLFGPRGKSVIVASDYPPCAPCRDLSARSASGSGGECLAAIEPRIVIDAIRQLLGEPDR